jgi:hypothetical protein
MKDYLERHKWVNRFPNNPTQTKYIRFLKMPQSGVVSPFTKSRDEFKRRMEAQFDRFNKSASQSVG